MNCSPQHWLRSRHGLAAFCLGALVLMSVSLTGQQPVVGVTKTFIVPEYYPAPNQNQLKWLLTGSNAVPQGTISRLILDQVNLETYKENGERDVKLQSDSCLFDSTRKMITSESRITVQTADCGMFIEGTGFCWQATNSRITISNQVHTIIKRAPAAAKPDKP